MTRRQARDVRFGRLERRGLLLGLSGAQLALVGSALIVVVAAGPRRGAGRSRAQRLRSGPARSAWALVPVGGRPLVEVLPVAGAVGRASGTRTRQRRSRDARRGEPTDAARFPGVPGRLRITVDRSAAPE